MIKKFIFQRKTYSITFANTVIETFGTVVKVTTGNICINIGRRIYR